MRSVNRKITALLIAGVLVIVAAGAMYFISEEAKRRIPEMAVVKHAKGGYTFMLNGKPFIIKGVCYNPIPVNESYSYNFWADPGKPWLVDGKLMKKMGMNSIRIYRVGENPPEVKRVVRDFHRKFGIRTFIGHFLGFWDSPPANYANPHFRQKMKKEVLDMVKTYKDEPGILGWILGNENNYSFDLNVRPWSSEELDQIDDLNERRQAKARIYYTFVNEIAEAIREIDPVRPVIMGVGEIKSLKVAANVTPAVDILGVIAYRGATFGNLFRQIKQEYDKPVLLIEYGADRYNAYTRQEDEESQARFLQLQWKDIERNSTAKTEKGNVIGGLLFEWSDEWWKSNENAPQTWGIHDETAQWSNSSYYYDYEVPGRMNINEEWFGIVGLKPRPKELTQGIDKRVPKKSYYALKELWTQS